MYFDMTFSEHPYPHIWIQTDGGARIEATLEKYMRICAEGDGMHTVTVIYKSAVEMQHRWHEPLIGNIAMSQFEYSTHNAPFSYNDLDMLIVGLNGKGFIGMNGCTYDEYQTNFALWALMSSPLMISCDIRDMNEETKNILMNKELIDINQDIEGRQGYAWKIHKDEDYYGIAKVLLNGDYAFGLFNFSDNDCTITNSLNIKFWDIGLPLGCGYGFEMRDVINHKDIGLRKS